MIIFSMKKLIIFSVLLLIGCKDTSAKSQWDVWVCEGGRAFYTHITESGKAEALIYDEKITKIAVNGDKWTFDSAEALGQRGTIIFTSRQAILTSQNIEKSPPVNEWSYACSFSRKIEL